MLLGEEIKEKGIVKGGVDSVQRGTSYDLRIGKIFTSDGKTHDSFLIKPQGIVEVVSLERVEMPSDVAGTAMVKTGLSDRGILALNIGIIDPRYKGKISSYLVNFGRTNQIIKVGDPFIRVCFFQLSGKSKFSKLVEIKNNDYESNSQNKIVSLFSDTFLNTEEVITKFLDESIDKYRTRLLAYVSAAAFALAIITFLLNFGTFAAMQRWFDPRIAASGEVTTTLTELRKENAELKVRLAWLEAGNAGRVRPQPQADIPPPQVNRVVPEARPNAQ